LKFRDNLENITDKSTNSPPDSHLISRDGQDFVSDHHTMLNSSKIKFECPIPDVQPARELSISGPAITRQLHVEIVQDLEENDS
jgi:hypothetical protein